MNIPPAYAELVTSIEDGEVEAGTAHTRQLLASGHSAYAIFQEAIVPCLKEIGDRFGRMECYLPDLILATDVVKGIQEVLKEGSEGSEMAPVGRVLIGTVFGDVHDIGKNIVASMLRANGFEVIDIGVSVQATDFVRRAREARADIVAMSSLMSTSIPYMADVIDLIRDSEGDAARFKVLVGGGPVTREIAEKVHADGFGADAAEAVTQALALMRQR